MTDGGCRPTERRRSSEWRCYASALWPPAIILPMQSNRVVYDTDRGRTDRCSYCKRRLEACVCPNRPASKSGDGVVRVLRDRKGRRGKTVTVVSGLPGGDAALAE